MKGDPNVPASWQDDDAGKLETKMTEIAFQVVVTAEIQCRKALCVHINGWLSAEPNWKKTAPGRHHKTLC